MKPLYTIIIVFFSFCLCNNLSAQPGHNIIKQPPRINGVLKASTNAAAKAKIHANSNSVFGTSKTHPKYEKQTKRVDLKGEKELAATEKKDKKEK